LFYFACLAEREMQGHHASANTIFLQEELIHGSATMDVSPTISFTKSGGTFYIQQQQQALSCCYKFSNSGALSNKEYPHHPPSLLHLEAERETSNVTAAKGLDMLCVIAPPSVFWS
jgi:hypothetical protein